MTSTSNRTRFNEISRGSIPRHDDRNRFSLVRPASWCVSWSDTARDATTGPPSGYRILFVAKRDKFSLRPLIVATRDYRGKRSFFAVSSRGDTQCRELRLLSRGSFVAPRECRGERRLLSCLSLRQRFAPREGDRLVTKRYSLAHVGISNRSTDSENGNEYRKLDKNISLQLYYIKNS